MWARVRAGNGGFEQKPPFFGGVGSSSSGQWRIRVETAVFRRCGLEFTELRRARVRASGRVGSEPQAALIARCDHLRQHAFRIIDEALPGEPQHDPAAQDEHVLTFAITLEGLPI